MIRIGQNQVIQITNFRPNLIILIMPADMIPKREIVCNGRICPLPLQCRWTEEAVTNTRRSIAGRDLRIDLGRTTIRDRLAIRTSSAHTPTAASRRPASCLKKATCLSPPSRTRSAIRRPRTSRRSSACSAACRRVPAASLPNPARFRRRAITSPRTRRRRSRRA